MGNPTAAIGNATRGRSPRERVRCRGTWCPHTDRSAHHGDLDTAARVADHAPVSYTHLDVYKRQSLLHSARPDVLRVRPKEEGPQGTFTSHHGFGQFPWHSDGAIADHPPRFILLSAPIASRTPTELIRLRQGVPMLEALRGLVLITRLRRPRYFRAVDVTSGLTRVRWDPDKLSLIHI